LRGSGVGGHPVDDPFAHSDTAKSGP
jgi:hypothetical protein